jgi:protein-disulfide isomerase
VVYRHFPLPGHRYAMDAARASECAGAQGRFEAFHDALFARQPEIGIVPWSRLAQESGVPDLPRFEACLRDGGEVASIARDRAMAQRLEVNSTPTLLVNGARIEGARPLAALEGYVERARRRRE